MVDRFFSLITVRTSMIYQNEEALFLPNGLLSNTDHELPTIRRIYIFLEPRLSKF